MINEKEVSEDLKNVPDEEFLENIRKILFIDKRKYLRQNIFQVKILMLKELSNRKKLVIKHDSPTGPYITGTKNLDCDQVDIILKKYSYIKEPLECIVYDKRISFNKILTI